VQSPASPVIVRLVHLAPFRSSEYTGTSGTGLHCVGRPCIGEVSIGESGFGKIASTGDVDDLGSSYGTALLISSELSSMTCGDAFSTRRASSVMAAVAVHVTPFPNALQHLRLTEGGASVAGGPTSSLSSTSSAGFDGGV